MLVSSEAVAAKAVAKLVREGAEGEEWEANAELKGALADISCARAIMALISEIGVLGAAEQRRHRGQPKLLELYLEGMKSHGGVEHAEEVALNPRLHIERVGFVARQLEAIIDGRKQTFGAAVGVVKHRIDDGAWKEGVSNQ